MDDFKEGNQLFELLITAACAMHKKGDLALLDGGDPIVVVPYFAIRDDGAMVRKNRLLME